MSRAIAETMPRVTVPPRPKGLPTAITSSPTRTLSLSPSASSGRSLASILSSARSVCLSVPMHLGVELAVVGQAHLHRVGVVDDVVVGDDVAVVLDRRSPSRAPRPAVPWAGPAGPARLRPSGMPKRRKNSSNGEPGPKGDRLGPACRRLVLVAASWVASTVTTAGLVRSTRSATALRRRGHGGRGRRSRRRRSASRRGRRRPSSARGGRRHRRVLRKVAMRVIGSKPLVCSSHTPRGSVDRQDRARI